MIYIIGIDHPSHQTETLLYKESVLDLRDALQQLVDQYGIQLIAEEFSKESLQRSGIEKTPAQEFAETHSIQYLMVDPDSQERRALGIRTRHDTAMRLGIDIFTCTDRERDLINQNHKDADKLREMEWLNRIKPYALTRNVAFLSGFEHTNSFQKLLVQNGFEATIHTILDY